MLSPAQARHLDALAANAASQRPVALLCVCLGNICRSPLAEALLQHHANLRGLAPRLAIDSCGTGSWHVGADADPRTHLIAANHAVTLTHVARQVDADEDAQRFDLILPMDQRNRADLLDLGLPADRTILFRRFDPACADLPDHKIDVPDPYYGAHDGFQVVFNMLDAAAQGLLDRLFTHSTLR
jgi:protein-tyrosine phosphatase